MRHRSIFLDATRERGTYRQETPSACNAPARCCGWCTACYDCVQYKYYGPPPVLYHWPGPGRLACLLFFQSPSPSKFLLYAPRMSDLPRCLIDAERLCIGLSRTRRYLSFEDFHRGLTLTLPCPHQTRDTSLERRSIPLHTPHCDVTHLPGWLSVAKQRD